MAKSKATKKFEKNKLTKVLEQRNAVKKIKQRVKTSKKRKTEDREYYNDEQASGDDEEAEKKKKKPKGASATDGELFENMSVEQFFQGGFEVPSQPAKESKKKEKSGKRKRDETEGEAIAEGGSDSEGEGSDTIEGHKDQLAALAEKDPEFFKYLQENDSELLDFKMAEQDDLSAISDLEDDDEEEEEVPSKKGKKSKAEGDDKSKIVKKAQIEQWEKSLKEQNSLRATREVVLAFRAAAHVGEAEEKNFKYSIANPDVYHDLLVLALKRIPEVLNHHLPVKELPSGKIRISTDSAKFKTLTTLLKSHSSSLLHLLSNLTDSSTTKLVLNSTLGLIPYLLSFRRFLRDFVKQVVEIWSSPSTEDSARVTAYLVLRKLVVIGDSTLQEACLKAAYNGLLKGCRGTTTHTLPSINLMKNGGIDLFGVDEDLSYMLGFSYIRQLAVHLRNSITNNSKESYKQVYNWQYVHSLDFWSRVLATHCDGLKQAEKGKQSPLHPLIYPLVQVTLGAARLIPTAQYFPLRLHLVRSLIRLSRHTGTYIPLASIILEILTSNEMKKAPKASTLKPLDFATIIRVPKSYLRTRVLQDGVGDQVVEVLSEFFVLWATSVAFPELIVPPVMIVRKYLKKASAPGTGNKNVRFNNALAGLVTRLENNAKWIEEKRRDVNFGPGRMDEVMGFSKSLEWEKSPLGVYVITQRNVRDERRKNLEEAKKEEEKREKKEKESGKTKANKKSKKSKHAVEEEESDEDISDDDDEESLQFESDEDDE
ncbi:Nucleolar Complex 2 protein [Orbilia oligospora]|uniref:Nucleolar Complex 2 protein n=1 Tax=Orbilia oligospora TaxID=2813651 RepID=A0A8H8UYR9_ORBOL|nr:Nucleolar Complex 2 protein [Orbilia oligospora]